MPGFWRSGHYLAYMETGKPRFHAAKVIIYFVIPYKNAIYFYLYVSLYGLKQKPRLAHTDDNRGMDGGFLEHQTSRIFRDGAKLRTFIETGMTFIQSLCLTYQHLTSSKGNIDIVSPFIDNGDCEISVV